jgi:hypothetical protein
LHHLQAAAAYDQKATLPMKRTPFQKKNQKKRKNHKLQQLASEEPN